MSKRSMDAKLEQAILNCMEATRPLVDEGTWREFTEAPTEDLPLYHFGLGLYLRNNVLTPNSELYRLFRVEGYLEKDDMSSLMLRVWHEELNT